jgi:hypothetical protein
VLLALAWVRSSGVSKSVNVETFDVSLFVYIEFLGCEADFQRFSQFVQFGLLPSAKTAQFMLRTHATFLTQLHCYVIIVPSYIFLLLKMSLSLIYHATNYFLNFMEIFAVLFSRFQVWSLFHVAGNQRSADCLGDTWGISGGCLGHDYYKGRRIC